MNDFAQALTAISAGIMIGFLGVGALARGIDATESMACPNVMRVQVNTSTILKDWAAWGACPRAGLITPMKP